MVNVTRAAVLLSMLVSFSVTPCTAQTRVRKCVAADGSVSYVDAPACPGDAKGSEQLIPEHRVTLTENEEARLQGRQPPMSPADAATERQRLEDAYPRATADAQGASAGGSTRPNPSSTSYRCSAAGGVWYTHDPCPATIGGGWVRGRDEAGELKMYETQGVRVEQQSVPRSVACKEINSAHSLTRPGRQLDQTSNPYDKLNGKDPCS